jgi:hypothetical protein
MNQPLLTFIIIYILLSDKEAFLLNSSLSRSKNILLFYFKNQNNVNALPLYTTKYSS